MKKVILFFCFFLFPALCFSRTAEVTYNFSQHETYTVGVFVSETPNLPAQEVLSGAIDTDANGVVDLFNVQPGKTYYFRARAWHKTSGIPTDWSNEVSYTIPADSIPNPNQLPEIPVVSIPGFTVQGIIIAPVKP